MKGTLSLKLNAIIILIVAIALPLGIFYALKAKRSVGQENTSLISASNASYVKTPLCDGYDWQKISNFNITAEEKMRLKASLLKISIESSALSNNPLIQDKIDFARYVVYINNFYRDNNNSTVPLFFALKIADMARNGASQKELQLYKLSVLKKLKNIGLVQ